MMEDHSRAPIVKFPKDRSASYQGALLYIVAARARLEHEGIIDLPPLGEPLFIPAPRTVCEAARDFVRRAWAQTEPLLGNVPNASTTPRHIRDAITAGWHLVMAPCQPQLSSSEYERWRTIITTRFLVPVLASRPHWPPPLQTLLNHLGPSWDDVKVSAGWHRAAPICDVQPAAQDEPVTIRASYLQSLATYLRHCDGGGHRPAQARYKGWAGTELAAGRQHPSVSTLRITFGSWTQALSLAREVGSSQG